MSTATATITIKNQTGQKAAIQFSHQNTTFVVEKSQVFTLDSGKTSGGTTVHFTTGTTELDYWWIGFQLLDGSSKGQSFGTSGTIDDPWTECQLESSDAGKTQNFVVNPGYVSLNILSGGDTASVSRTPYAPGAKAQHVFVLMMENRSFDHMLGFSGLSGTDPTNGKSTKITGLAGTETNIYGSSKYQVVKSSNANPTLDPGHEFIDVLWQLAGGGATYPSGGSYPKINNSGFVYDYVN
ncbi:MAG: alkaline phosphatase family protein, partial [Thermoanaerobaculia bacterium]